MSLPGWSWPTHWTWAELLLQLMQRSGSCAQLFVHSWGHWGRRHEALSWRQVKGCTCSEGCLLGCADLPGECAISLLFTAKMTVQRGKGLPWCASTWCWEALRYSSALGQCSEGQAGSRWRIHCYTHMGQISVLVEWEIVFALFIL